MASSHVGMNSASAAVLHDHTLEWFTLESKYFRCHYHTGGEALARRSLAIAEDVHAELSLMFDWVPEDKTDIILTDEYDIPNGLASPFPSNRTSIFVSAPDSVESLEDNSDWLETVIKHEYVHILHLDKATGAAAYMRKIFGRIEYLLPFFTAFPNTYQPAWIIEGLATYIETDKERGIGRGQSTYFDMFMRMEALGNFKSLEQVNVPNIADWPLNTTRYLYGVNFFQFLEQHYGKQKITGMVDNYSDNFFPWQLNSNAEESIGKDLYALWDEFEVATKAKYKTQSEAVIQRGELVGKKITDQGYFTGPLKVLDNGDIYYIDYNADERRSLKLIQAKKEGCYKEPIKIIKMESAVRFDVHPDAGIVLAKPERCRNAAIYYDLFHVDIKTKKETRLTQCARYKMVSWSKDGKKIIAVKNTLSKNELHLLDSNGQLKETLWKGQYAEVVSFIDWSPTENKIIASVFRPQTGWNLEIFNLETKEWLFLTEDDAIETTPVFSADGKSILYSSDHGGTYNIRSMNLETAETKSLTDLIGGGFYPIQTKNDTNLYYIGYTSAGFDVFKLALNELREVPAANKASTAVALQSKKIETDIIIGAAKEYSAADSFMPRWFHPTAVFSSDFYEIGAFTYSWDALARHIYRVAASYIEYDSNFTDWSGEVNYVYDRYYPILKLSASRSNNLFRSNTEGLVRIRGNNVFQAEVVFPLLTMSDRLSFHLSVIKDNDSDSWRKNSNITSLADINDNLIGAAVIYNNTSTHARSNSRAEGRVIQFSAEKSDAFGDSFYQGNVYTLDWREYIRLGREHVIALRGVVADGSNNSKSFRLGGINEANFEPQLLAATSASSPFNRREYNLRGYDEGYAELTGRNMQLMSIEYRFPVWRVERASMYPPIGIENISGSVFIDRGAAWNDGGVEKYYTGIGAELYLDTIFGYHRVIRITLGYAQGQDDIIGKEQYYARIGASF